MKRCHHGDEGDHEGLRLGWQMETCDKFFGEGQINDSDCMGTRWRVLWSYRENYCVFTFYHHRKSRSPRRGVEEFKEDYML